MVAKITRLIKKILDKYFLILLVLVVVLAYGQTLLMYVWQDDNALFFKLAHLEGQAGYLGVGPLGSGPYKYTAFFYIPIYYLFGYQTVYYFIFNFVIYVLSVLVIYKVFSDLFGKTSGRVTSFIYAAGYIASDGFIRLFNSNLTSLSAILISLFFWSYYKFYKLKKPFFYFLTILFFFLASEFIKARTHYLIAIVILIELFFFAFNNKIKGIFFSFVRLIPFLLIFYEYFIKSGDHRSGQVGVFLNSLADGNFYELYGFLSSFSNLILPEWIIKSILASQLLPLNKYISVNIIVALAVGLLFVVANYFIYRNQPRFKLVFTSSLVLLGLWTFFSRSFYKTPVLNTLNDQILIAFIGGVLIIWFGFLTLVLKNKRLYLLFLLWILFNIAAYSAYNPLIAYEVINRYLAHSFFALAALYGILIFSNVRYRNIILVLALIFAFSNLISGFIYQRNIVLERSNPPREFYNSLLQLVPKLNKGDIFYFDVADDSQSAFREAFSVAQMPETTAIAWRYGVDRYDISMFTDYKQLNDYVGKNKVPLDRVHTFFYKDKKLVDTSVDFKKSKQENFQAQVKFIPTLMGSSRITVISGGSEWVPAQLVFDLKKIVKTLVPLQLSIDVRLKPLPVEKITFPLRLSNNQTSNPIYNNLDNIKLAFDFKDFIQNFQKNTGFNVSSDWRERKAENLKDGDLESIWQADRITWRTKKAQIEMELANIENIDRLIWVNGYADNTPVKYFVEISLDAKNWIRVAQIENIQRIADTTPQVVKFNPVNAKFVRIVFVKTLNDDSVALKEIWVMPSRFQELKQADIVEYLSNPFASVNSADIYQKTLELANKQFSFKLEFKNNKTNSFESTVDTTINALYSGLVENYKVLIPAGGTEITQLRLREFKVPGEIEVSNLEFKKND